jgi:predicted nucleic acid-binding protein
MDVAFLDTNALMKLYLTERGSTWLTNFVNTRQVVVSELALIETATVLRRLYIEGRFSRIEAFDLFSQIKQDSTKFEIIPLSGDAFLNRLGDLVFNMAVGFRIRALDGIHLTAATIALADINNFASPPNFTFVSSDAQLLRAAQAQGFVTENPENYP